MLLVYAFGTAALAQFRFEAMQSVHQMTHVGGAGSELGRVGIDGHSRDLV